MATPRAAQHRDLEQRLRDIEGRLREVITVATRRPKFEVSEGDLTISGGDLVVDGGDFLLLDTDGSTVFRLGPQFFGDRGVAIFREDGSQSFYCTQPFDGYDGQIMGLLDRFGNDILQESPFGEGREAPYQAMPFQPVGTAGTAPTCGPFGWERAVTSTSFVDAFRWRGHQENPWARFRFNVRFSNTTTSCEVRVVDKDTGNGLQGFLVGSAWTGSVAMGSTADQSLDTPYGLAMPGGWMGAVDLAVQVRRTAGTGTINLAVVTAQGGPV